MSRSLSASINGIKLAKQKLERRRLSHLARENVKIDAALQLALAEWIAPKSSQHPAEVVRAIDALAVNSPAVQYLLGEILKQLIRELQPTQIDAIVKKLKHIPPQIESYLEQTATAKESRIALLKVYRKQAANNLQPALDKILGLCGDLSRDVALDAAGTLLESIAEIVPEKQQQQSIEMPVTAAAAKSSIDCQKLLPIFTKSPFVGVRQNCLKAYLKTVEGPRGAPAREITDILAALGQETAPEVILLMYKLIDSAIGNRQTGGETLNIEIAEETFNLIQRVVKLNDRKTLNMTAKSAFLTLDRMALRADKKLSDRIGECARSLLLAVDTSGKIDKSIVTGLLSKLARFDTELLGKIVEEDIASRDGEMPADNQVAVAMAIVRDRGRNAALLDEILERSEIPEEVKSRIIRERGG